MGTARGLRCFARFIVAMCVVASLVQCKRSTCLELEQLNCLPIEPREDPSSNDLFSGDMPFWISKLVEAHTVAEVNTSAVSEQQKDFLRSLSRMATACQAHFDTPQGLTAACPGINPNVGNTQHLHFIGKGVDSDGYAVQKRGKADKSAMEQFGEDTYRAVDASALALWCSGVAACGVQRLSLYCEVLVGPLWESLDRGLATPFPSARAISSALRDASNVRAIRKLEEERFEDAIAAEEALRNARQVREAWQRVSERRERKLSNRAIWQNSHLGKTNVSKQ